MPTRRSTAKKAAVSERVELEVCLEIDRAESLLAQLKQALEQPKPVVLKADKVESVTTACMQLFCVLNRALASRGQQIQWLEPSEKLCEVARLLGLREALGLPE